MECFTLLHISLSDIEVSPAENTRDKSCKSNSGCRDVCLHSSSLNVCVGDAQSIASFLEDEQGVINISLDPLVDM